MAQVRRRKQEVNGLDDGFENFVGLSPASTVRDIAIDRLADSVYDVVSHKDFA